MTSNGTRCVPVTRRSVIVSPAAPARGEHRPRSYRHYPGGRCRVLIGARHDDLEPQPVAQHARDDALRFCLAQCALRPPSPGAIRAVVIAAAPKIAVRGAVAKLTTVISYAVVP